MSASGPLHVVLAGAQELDAGELGSLAERLGVAGRRRMPGYMPDAKLERLWRMASCSGFTTRAEGFGLPVLEAMRCGVPVACAHIPALREVAADFALDEPADAARSIRAAIADGHAAERGRARAARFTWEAAARGTYAAYEAAVAAGCTLD